MRRITLADISPKRDERLLIVGRSGTGKTTILKKLIEPMARTEPVIIFDSKPDFDPVPAWKPSKNIYKKLPGMLLFGQLKPGLYVYHTKYPDYADPMVGRICLAALKRKNVTLVFDEIMDFVRGTLVPMPIAKVLRQGRSKNVRVIVGSQRPAGIPRIALTEASKVIAFRLTSQDDRLRLSKEIAPDMLQQPGPGRYDFWFMDVLSQEKAELIHQQ